MSPPCCFIKSYLDYVGESEVPTTFHRWSALAGIGAILERNIYVPHGHSNMYPNQYMMLIGTSGTRKTSAISIMRSLLIKAGYTTIAAERTSKEKFLMDLSGEEDGASVDDILSKNLFGDTIESDIRPMSILADEANDFFGIGNMEFLSILGRLWDWNGPPYTNRIKTGKSVSIPNPTVSILSGNTPTSFAQAFPPEIVGQGFFSRLLLVYGEPNGVKITFPRRAEESETRKIVGMLQEIKRYYSGELTYVDGADTTIDKIYKSNTNMTGDTRFDSFHQRRLSHLLKLCTVVAASKLSKVITPNIVIEANTYLSYAESLMPKALGEFGKSRNSDVVHKVLAVIESHGTGIRLKELMKAVSVDLDKPSDLGEILRKLSFTEKIHTSGDLFLPVGKRGLKDIPGMVDLSYLTQDELNIKG